MTTQRFQSHYNDIIYLKKEENGYTIIVNEYIQSGTAIERIWDEAFEKLISNYKNTNKILILGFAGGSIMKPINSYFPKAEVYAVEIDPIMITLAKKYFPENTKDVKLIESDAIKFIKKTKQKFDLIIVDCYLGDAQPQDTNSINFFVKLKTLTPTVLLNQLFIPTQKNELGKISFVKELDNLYKVTALKLPYNIIFKF